MRLPELPDLFHVKRASPMIGDATPRQREQFIRWMRNFVRIIEREDRRLPTQKIGYR